MSKTTQILITLSLVLTACGGSEFTGGESTDESTGGNSGVSNTSVAGIAGMDTSKSTGGSSSTDTSTVVKATGGSSVKGTTGPSSSTGGQGLGTGGSAPSSTGGSAPNSTGGSNPGTGGSKTTGGSSTTSTGGSSTCKPATCEQVCQGSSTQCSSVTDPVNYPISCPKSNTCGSTMQCYCSLGGDLGTGGNPGTGGSSALGTGGSKTTGGSSAQGTGGSNPSTGGTPTTGGSSALATGGTPGTGGSSAITTGGSPSTGGSSAQGTGGSTAIARTAKSVSVYSIAAGSNSCVVVSDGSVECWGSATYITLGSNASTSTTTPTKVAGITNATSVSVTFDHNCAVLSDGMVQCWGKNTAGQLGTGTKTNNSAKVTGITNATSVVVAQQYSCALLKDGTVQCWGLGWLGNGSTSSLVPVQATGLTGVIALGAGDYQACAAMLPSNTVKCWGQNQLTPALPFTQYGIYANSISIGNLDTCALQVASNGLSQLTCWGDNSVGQLGSGDTSVHALPYVSSISNFSSISVGTYRICAIVNDGTVQCWGNNYHNPLGYDTVPTTVPGFTNIASISATAGYLCAISTTGSLQCLDDTVSGGPVTINF